MFKTGGCGKTTTLRIIAGFEEPSGGEVLKRMIDRTFAIEDYMEKKVFYLLSAAATRKETNVQTMIKCFRQYISCFGENGSEEGGIVFAYDTRKTEDVKTMYDILNKVYEMGKSV